MILDCLGWLIKALSNLYFSGLSN